MFSFSLVPGSIVPVPAMDSPAPRCAPSYEHSGLPALMSSRASVSEGDYVGWTLDYRGKSIYIGVLPL